jgi:L-fuconolactonase
VIVDTHVHVWEVPPIAPIGGTAPGQSGGPTEPAPVELLLEDIDAHGVDWAVLVQSSLSTWDNGYVADSAQKYPDRFISHGMVDPLDPDNATTAAYWMDERGMTGFRFHPLYYELDDPAQGRILMRPENEPMFEAISERQGIIQIHSRSHHADQLDYAAGRYPGITWLIDHMMYPHPEWAAEDWAPYHPVLALAQHSNIYMKISDVSNHSNEDFPHRDMHEVVKRAIDAFGVDRCLWGTGFPGPVRTRYNRPTLDEELRIVREAFDWLSDGDRAKILGDNAARIWQLS